MIVPPPPTPDSELEPAARDPFFAVELEPPRSSDTADITRAIGWAWKNAGRIAVVLGAAAMVATHWYWLMTEVRAVRRELEFQSVVLSCLAEGRTDCARHYLARRPDGQPRP